MKLPANFSAIIADNFYDKEFTVNRKTRSKDEEGGVIITTSSVGIFTGNVQHASTSKQTLSLIERGLIDRVDLEITTSTNNDIKVDDELVYSNKHYTVKGAFTYDSHLLVVCEAI